MKLTNEAKQAWEDAKLCDCGDDDCHPNQHRLCAVCGGTIIHGAHESVKSQKNSKWRWNVDHIIPISKNGKDVRSNRQAVHVECNKQKSNY